MNTIDTSSMSSNEPSQKKLKVQKTPKEPKIPKTKEPKKEPKEPKEPKEAKLKISKEPKVKAPKESKIKEPKIKKEPKVKLPKEPKVPKVKNKPMPDANIIVTMTECTPPILKKRGRKPKGGKIISSFTTGGDSAGITDSISSHTAVINKPMVQKQSFVSSNVILHLKCNYSDLHVNNSMSSFTYEPVVENVESYINCGDLSETAGTFTESVAGIYTTDDVNSIIDTDGLDIGVGKNGTNGCNESNGHQHVHANIVHHAQQHTQHINMNKHMITTALSPASNQPTNTMCVPIKSSYVIASTSTQQVNNSDIIINQIQNPQCAHAHTAPVDSDIEMKEVWRKINRLKLVLHKDNTRFNSAQQSGCFWCTCDFDTPVIYIPKLYTKSTDSYVVYGCFCSPECATSYLMKETIDTSTRFERYQMLNVMYNNICNNTDKPIKPAPDPHYLLSKFYGNLSIEEYRKLLKSDHLLYIVNKPLTHSLPELYEDNNEFLVNNKTTIPNAMSKTKKK